LLGLNLKFLIILIILIKNIFLNKNKSSVFKKLKISNIKQPNFMLKIIIIWLLVVMINRPTQNPQNPQVKIKIFKASVLSLLKDT
jgi:hypothetical protein